MASGKGNYIPWSVAQILAGILCGLLAALGAKPYVSVPAALAVLVLYKTFFPWKHRASFEETRRMLRVFSLSGMAALALSTLALIPSRLVPYRIPLVWSAVLLSRGVFGLAGFLGTGDSPVSGAGKECVP